MKSGPELSSFGDNPISPSIGNYGINSGIKKVIAFASINLD
jgi:hypothetical protein